MSSSELVCVAQVLSAHSIRGGLLLKVFTEEPDQLMHYSPLICQDHGKDKGLLTLKNLRLKTADTAVVYCQEIDDRTLAETYRGCQLYVKREQLPALEADTFFFIDLVGCRVEDTQGVFLGTLFAVHNFSAGYLLEITKPNKGSMMIPFNKEAVPHVDLSHKIVRVDRAIFDQFDI